MKRAIILSVLSFAFLGKSFAQSTPREWFDDLFVAVQMQSVFPDQKTFVDCIPKEEPQKILDEYHSEKNDSAFDLKKFVTGHFNLPDNTLSNYSSNISAGVVAHINELWKVLSRNADTSRNQYNSLLPLPYPYIVPGGRFREIYYWDSYFTMLGLKESRDTIMIEEMINNFSYLINHYGFIPNGNRTYYLSRSQPPFFSLMIDLLAELKGDGVYQEYLPSLLKEYSYWMKDENDLAAGEAKYNVVNADGNILNRNYDYENSPREESYKQDVEAVSYSTQPVDSFYRNIRAAAESGWDFSSRWFGDGLNLSTIHTTDLIPVDLNCLLQHLEITIAKAYQLDNDTANAKLFLQKVKSRQNAILKYCWNDSLKFFCDYDFKLKKQINEPTLAGMFPLLFQLATSQQGKEESKVIQHKFLKQGGVVATLQNTGQQWDAPNGWAPLEFISVEGLKNYNKNALAKKIAKRWIDLNVQVFKSTGKLLEKYNVENVHLAGGGGEYPLQDGFGWTNGVLLKLMDEYKINQKD